MLPKEQERSQHVGDSSELLKNVLEEFVLPSSKKFSLNRNLFPSQGKQFTPNPIYLAKN